MKKKLLIIVFTFISIFIFSGEISARECKYKYDGKDIIVNTKDENGVLTMTYNESDWNDDKKLFTNNFLDPSVLSNDQQCWKTINVCKVEKSAIAPLLKPVLEIGGSMLGGGSASAAVELIDYFLSDTNIGIFSSSLDTQTIDDANANVFDPTNESWWVGIFTTTSKAKCKTIEYSGSEISKENLISSCDKFTSMFNDVTNAYRDYLGCGEYIDGAPNSKKTSIGVCKGKALSKVNKYTDIMSKTCNSILQNQSISSSDGCAESCLNAVERVKDLKSKYIKQEDNSAKCGFSKNLIGWIDNILSIVKYILPVLVIIFGIIDFIRAIASDKDDEMKKAQGRFVKRLIAAALAFIIPFIIVFVLEKFGFVAEGCGVISLK